MKPYFQLTEAQISAWVCDFVKAVDQLVATPYLVIDRNTLIPEERVAQLLGVSERTMRNYRNKKKLHFVKLEGQIFYIQMILFFDLLQLCLSSKR